MLTNEEVRLRLLTYPNSLVIESSENDDNHVAQFVTDDTMDEIRIFYKSLLPEFDLRGRFGRGDGDFYFLYDAGCVVQGVVIDVLLENDVNKTVNVYYYPNTRVCSDSYDR